MNGCTRYINGEEMHLVFKGNWQILKARSVQRMKKCSCGPAAVLQIEARQYAVQGLFTLYFFKFDILQFHLPEIPLICPEVPLTLKCSKYLGNTVLRNTYMARGYA